MHCYNGIPKHLVIRYNWSMSDSPGKSGSPVSISENKQPTAHTSTALDKTLKDKQ